MTAVDGSPTGTRNDAAREIAVDEPYARTMAGLRGTIACSTAASPKTRPGRSVQNSANLKWPVQQNISSRVVNNGRPAGKNCVIQVYVVVDIGHDLLSLSSCRSFGSPRQPRCSVSVTTQYADGLTPGSCL
jgi:hypothetical protein